MSECGRVNSVCVCVQIVWGAKLGETLPRR